MIRTNNKLMVDERQDGQCLRQMMMSMMRMIVLITGDDRRPTEGTGGAWGPERRIKLEPNRGVEGEGGSWWGKPLCRTQVWPLPLLKQEETQLLLACMRSHL